MEKFKQGEERCLRCETLQCCFEASGFSFQINAETLPLSEAFPYLVRTIAYSNRDWASVYLNLQTYQRRWGMVARVIERMGATVRSRGAMHKAVAQSVILYDIENWVMTG